MKPGDKVGSSRWPMMGSHPDCWGRPWCGTVLDINDPRSWINTVAFPRTSLENPPSQEAVDAHVADLRSRQLLRDALPVLWDFGDEQRVYWESNLRPYEEDVRLWEVERAKAYGNLTPVS